MKLPVWVGVLYSPFLWNAAMWLVYWFAVPVDYLGIPYWISVSAILFTDVIIGVEIALAFIHSTTRVIQSKNEKIPVRLRRSSITNGENDPEAGKLAAERAALRNEASEILGEDITPQDTTHVNVPIESKEIAGAVVPAFVDVTAPDESHPVGIDANRYDGDVDVTISIGADTQAKAVTTANNEAVVKPGAETTVSTTGTTLQNRHLPVMKQKLPSTPRLSAHPAQHLKLTLREEVLRRSFSRASMSSSSSDEEQAAGVGGGLRVAVPRRSVFVPSVSVDTPTSAPGTPFARAVHRAPQLRHQDDDARPTLLVIIAAFIPNECFGIEDTIKHYCNLPDHKEVRVTPCLAYNGKIPAQGMDIMRRVSKICWAVHVQQSHSKAENINYVIDKQLAASQRDRSLAVDYMMVMDADHRPAPGSLAHAVGLLQAHPSSDAVQGCCAVDPTRSAEGTIGRMLGIIICMEYAEMYCIHHSGGSALRSFGLFGGSNAVWRAPVLSKMAFDPEMLTEDIDLSMRALRAGHRVIYSNEVVSFEEPPPSIFALYKQRLRWAHGWTEVTIRHSWGLLTVGSVRQRIAAFLLLPWRELFVYLSPHALPAGTIHLIKKGCCDDLFWTMLGVGLFVAAIPIFKVLLLPFVSNVKLPPLRERLIYILATIPYEAFKVSIARIGHLRWILRDRAWNVTPRKTTQT